MAGVAGFVVVGGGVADAGDQFFAKVDVAGDAAGAVGEQQLAVLAVDAVLGGAVGFFDATAVAIVKVSHAAGAGELIGAVEGESAPAIVADVTALVIAKAVAAGDSAEAVIEVGVAELLAAEIFLAQVAKGVVGEAAAAPIPVSGADAVKAIIKKASCRCPLNHLTIINLQEFFLPEFFVYIFHFCVESSDLAMIQLVQAQ